MTNYNYQPPVAPPAVPPGYELKRKKPIYKRVWFWLLLIVVVFVVAVIASAGKAVNDATSKEHTVTYKVNGTGKANITYTTINGDGKDQTISEDGQSLPWSKEVTVKGSMSIVSVTASATDPMNDKSKVECELLVDGKSVSTDTGNSMLASCTGSGYDGK